MEILLTEVKNDVVFGILVDGTLVDVTDDEGIGLTLPTVLINIVDVSSVLDAVPLNIDDDAEISSLVETTLVEEGDVTEICSLPDVLEEGIVDSTVDRSSLDVALISAAVYVVDGVMIEASNDNWLLLDISMVDVTDGR